MGKFIKRWFTNYMSIAAQCIAVWLMEKFVPEYKFTDDNRATENEKTEA